MTYFQSKTVTHISDKPHQNWKHTHYTAMKKHVLYNDSLSTATSPQGDLFPVFKTNVSNKDIMI